MKLKITDKRLDELSKNIAREISSLDEKIEKANHNLKELRDARERLRNYCPHTITKHHPRAVAEDDDYDVCEICGAML